MASGPRHNHDNFDQHDNHDDDHHDRCAGDDDNYRAIRYHNNRCANVDVDNNSRGHLNAGSDRG